MGLISRVSSRTYRSPNMQIYLRDTEINAVEVDPSTTVAELKTNLALTGNLIANGELLMDDSTLENLQEESTIQVVHPVLGGGRKRKKKVYTTPKKIKHKRTKVKLATLKLYKVDDVGKLERKRKECPQEMCGAGIFLSNHKDRQYCGKCGLTIKFNENQ